uniref:Tensin 3 n=1 Tax=Macrostomum lignano TaxID=282301 RepID=A0A1I8F8P6_9PLAT
CVRHHAGGKEFLELFQKPGHAQPGGSERARRSAAEGGGGGGPGSAHEASVPTGADQPPPKCRYCLVFEGSKPAARDLLRDRTGATGALLKGASLWYTIALLRQFSGTHPFAPPVLWYTIALLRQFSGTPSLCSPVSLYTIALLRQFFCVHHRFAPHYLVHHRSCSRQYSRTPSFAPPVLLYTIALIRSQFFGTPSLCSASTRSHYRFAPPVLWYTIRFAPCQLHLEHDIPERVELSVFADSQRLHSLAFNFTPDPLLGVAADIADKFPLVPESLSSLASGGQAAADTDRRLCAALRKCGRLADAAPRRASRTEGSRRRGGPPFHCLAEAGWLESLAQLLRLTGQPEFWLLGQPEPEGGRTAVQLLRERRFRSLLASPRPLRACCSNSWTAGEPPAGPGGLVVVKVRSWRTPSGADLVFMTTNKEKADTPLEQDLSIFPHLEVGHSTPTKETACAQTEVGRSIEDLSGQPDSLRGSSGLSLRLRPLRRDRLACPSCSTHRPMRCGHFSSKQQQQQLEHASWSISTSSLMRMRPACRQPGRQQTMRRFQHPSQTRAPESWDGGGRHRWRASLTTRAAACLGSAAEPTLAVGRHAFYRTVSSLAAATQNCEASSGTGRSGRASCPGERAATGQRRGSGGGKIKGGGSRLATYEHSWRIANCRVCRRLRGPPERRLPLVCAVTVPCLPPMGKPSRLRRCCPRCHCLRDLITAAARSSSLRRLAEVSEEPFRD